MHNSGLVWDAQPITIGNETIHKIVLSKYQRNTKSQLWRQDLEGRLINEKYSLYMSPRNIEQIGGDNGTEIVLSKEKHKGLNWEWVRTHNSTLLLVLKGNRQLQARVYQLLEGQGISVGQYKQADRRRLHTQINRTMQIKGSGRLVISLDRQGPTKILQIRDQADNNLNTTNHQNSSSLSLSLNLPGLGISIVSNNEMDNSLEELMYVMLRDISLDSQQTLSTTNLALEVATIQIDNMLKPIEFSTYAIYIGEIPELSQNKHKESSVDRKISSSKSSPARPVRNSTKAFSLQAIQLPPGKSNKNVKLLEKVKLSIGDIYIHLEERFILKLVHFLNLQDNSKKVNQNNNGSGDSSLDNSPKKSSVSHPESILDRDISNKGSIAANSTSSTNASQFFETLEIKVKPVKLSILTSQKLSSGLLKVKSDSRLNFMLQIEQASLDFRDFKRKNLFESTTLIIDDLRKHYTDQVLSQAIKLLGTVDFLGNPVGLISDVRDGIKDLVTKRDLQSFVFNSVHGISNSAGKLVGTAGNMLSAVHLDDDHNNRRAKIRAYGHNSGQHLNSGLSSLVHGFQGMTTSLYTSTRDGAKKDGILGFGTGLFKGVTGTVTKPIAGVLDFAGEMALSVRDTVGHNQKIKKAIKPIRTGRVTTSMSKALQPFNFYESLALIMFERQVEEEKQSSRSSSSSSDLGSPSSSNSNLNLRSRTGLNLRNRDLNPGLPDFDPSTNGLLIEDKEVFYLCRIWEFRFEGEASQNSHNCYITNRRVVFYMIDQNSGKGKISYKFPFERMRKCEESNGKMIIKMRHTNSMDSLRSDDVYVVVANDSYYCEQMVFLVNKAISQTF